MPLLARVPARQSRAEPARRAHARAARGLARDRAAAGSTVDLDGKIDDPGAAVLDTAWNRLADAALTPVLGQPLADQLDDTLHRRFDLPPGGQFGGWHMYM